MLPLIAADVPICKSPLMHLHMRCLPTPCRRLPSQPAWLPPQLCCPGATQRPTLPCPPASPTQQPSAAAVQAGHIPIGAAGGARGGSGGRRRAAGAAAHAALGQAARGGAGGLIVLWKRSCEFAEQVCAVLRALRLDKLLGKCRQRAQGYLLVPWRHWFCGLWACGTCLPLQQHGRTRSTHPLTLCPPS